MNAPSESPTVMLADPKRVKPWQGRKVYARWVFRCTDTAAHAKDPEWHDLWYEPWWVVKVGPKRLLVEDAFGDQRGYVARWMIEKNGWGMAYGPWQTPIAAIYDDLPPEYVKRTLGYRLHVKKPLDVLGLDESAANDWPLIQKTYRALVMRHHPDRGGSSDDFKRVQAAWEALQKQ